MKLNATVADSHFDVEVRRDGERVFAMVDGRAYELEMRESVDGVLLIHQGKVFNCRVEGRPESGKPLEVSVGPNHYSIVLADPKRLRGATSVGAHGDGAARIVAPMPGKVVRIMVQVGDPVEAGSGIAVVEAMKMQNEMKSPKAGTVTAMNVQVGTTVNGGDVLAIIE